MQNLRDDVDAKTVSAGSGMALDNTTPSAPAATVPLGDTMITTAFELPGYRIVRNVGVARGITVRSRSVIGNFFGSNITIYTELREQARLDTYRDMVSKARRLRANAIIGMRYDATEPIDAVPTT